MDCIKLLTLLCVCKWTVNSLNDNEPVCTSRFDYDHKMLQKMLMLEMEQNKMKEKINEQNNKIEEQRNEITEQNNKIKFLEKTNKDDEIKKVEIERTLSNVMKMEGRGTTYIRWGRTSCPGNMTELVYKGYAGGSHYTHSGGASSYLCLPEDPLWNVYEDATQGGVTVWGAEYELGHSGRNLNRFFGKSVAERDVPCCVCRTSRSIVMMIPARNKCYDGWTLEYHGYLTGGFETNLATDSVCLDGDPESLAGGEDSKNCKLFYFIVARCGSLRCPPYVNGRELTCAVCSK